MNVTDIATEIYAEIGEPTDVLASTIIFWLKNNIGALNLLLETAFVIDSATNSITPAMMEDEKVIFKLLYEKYYYNKLLNTVLSTAAYQNGAIVEVQEGNRSIRLASKTEVAKSYQSVVGGLRDTLNGLVQAYKSNRNSPLEVVYLGSCDNNLPYDSNGFALPF